ncbi:MAG: uroporphyrinogen-III C-methyltransferase [Halioglobus sp.]|nr:uroporphyrinogen-III C-methyltransferase [Halioglobus sp.]
MSNQDAQLEGKTDAGATAVQAVDRKSPKRSPGVAWLALLLIVFIALAAAWLFREVYHRETALVQRVTALETAIGSEQASLDAASDRWQKQLSSGLAKLEESVDQETADLSRRIDARADQLRSIEKELDRFSATDRNTWLLAEAGHLVRLANQRLVMAQDPTASLALLNGADAVLLEIDDPSLHDLRAALASDIASLRAVPQVDIEGIYLRLSALVEQADKLVIFQLPVQADGPAPQVAQDWRGRLHQGYEAALNRLSSYLIIRRRDIPMQALMDPQWEGLVRQNLRMLLEQAQVALLSGNQTLYMATLRRALQWVDQFSDSDAARARAMSQEIRTLVDLTIGVKQPDISRSLQAMETALEQRGLAQGAQ